jgi:hypothetical protein
MSEREAAKEYGLARETVRKMLRYAVPPGYRRQQPARRPKLDAWAGTIDQILEEDKARGKKQRHTARRIFERPRDEHSYTGGPAGAAPEPHAFDAGRPRGIASNCPGQGCTTCFEFPIKNAAVRRTGADADTGGANSR